MFPFRYRTIFKNRWWAVLWAAGIIWTAVDFAQPDAPFDGNDQDAIAMRQAEQTLANLTAADLTK